MKSKKRARTGKRVSYSPGPIRNMASDLLEIGQTCKIAGQSGIVHNRHAIVLDAGSTGSRVHVYEFQCCGDKLVMLADELFEEVKPGLSSFEKDPMAAAWSLKPLLEKALERIPSFLHACTPLVLKATAGLRLLPERIVNEILTNVRSWLQTHPFLLAPHDDSDKAPVSVMDGSEEGVLAWVTVNFLNKAIGHLTDINVKDSSIVMDLGGGSTQIVFAVKDAATNKERTKYYEHPEYYYELKFHRNTHHLYQHSYLGYGLMEARKAIKNKFVQTRYRPEHTFACMASGYKEILNKKDDIVGDSGGFDRCLGVILGIFDKEALCPMKPCSFNGIHQPTISKNSQGQHPPVVAFSYFYDRLIPLGLTSPMTPFQIKEKASEICSTNPNGSSQMSRLLKKNPQWCLDATYMYALLVHGYGLDLNTSITVTKQIAGFEAGWALGSALKLLEQHENSCPVPPPLHFN